MSARRPAWQTEELQEEWIDLDPETSDDDHDQSHEISYGSQSISLTAPLSAHIQTNSDGGSETPSPSNSSRVVGTFLVREDAPAAHMPFLPKTPGRNKRNAIKDFFTPLPLERMFDPPTPPISTGNSFEKALALPPSPPQSAILRAGSESLQEPEDPEEDEILETDIPNMQSVKAKHASLGCQFTFTVPPEGGHALTPGNYPQAESTPQPPATNGLSVPATDPRLRLFQFQYDTYTREHLSAMVDSIAVNSGSGTTATTPPSYRQDLSRVTERTGDVSHLRSAKRLKLSPAVDFYGEGAGVGVVIARPPLTGKDYVGESRFLMEKIKQARDFSTISTVASLQSSQSSQRPSDGDKSPVYNSKIAKTQDSVLKRKTSAYLAVPEISNQQGPPSTHSTLASKSNTCTSRDYRQTAAELMEQIKTDMKGQKRIFSGDTDTSIATVDDHADLSHLSSSTHTNRSRPAGSGEKENHDPSSQSRGHRRTSSSKSNASRPNQTPSIAQSGLTPDELSQGLTRLSLEANYDPTDRPRPRLPSRLAPPSSSSSSVRANGNEDLHRFVSSSTASGATLTAGSAPSFVKHAGPAHLRTIAPGDLPPLPDRLGDMVFDKVMMKWVKSSAYATGDPNKSGVSFAETSDDPFGDIESLHDDSRGQGRHQEGRFGREEYELEAIEGQAGPRPTVAEMTAIEERSEVDDEEVELTSFSTDASMHLVDVMAGVESTGYDDETTDSDDDGEELEGTVTGQPVPVVDYESGDEDVSLANHHPVPTASVPLTPYAHPPHQPITRLSTPDKRDRPGQLATPLRSALKSGSATPTSALKGSRDRYQTPNRPVQHRRSVSFSDGRLDGPIQDLDESINTDSASSSRRSSIAPNATLPSARSKRIADMMDALADSDFGESPSKASSSGRPSEGLHTLTVRQPVTSPGRSNCSKRAFSRSQTQRPSPRRSKASDKANATFLTECSFGVAHDRLVEVITDVQPFVPFWDQLSAVDLSGKKLESVARLKEFLPRLDSLNLNSNQLAWLSGVPATVRSLSVAHNCISSLTSYSHLLNIENLDISHNEVDSLRQLECLRHLRELKADGNQITSAEGLQRMDGLVKLSLQGNSIQSLDLSQFRWTRLEMLNVSHNRLDSVQGLASLQALIAVNFDGNSLRKLEFGKAMPRLRILRLSSNKLTELTVIALPNLRTLYADNNSLSTVTRVDRLTKLENLSLRNQSGRTFNVLTRDVRDVKRLYLSGNPMKAPLLHEPCYNLVYLELAACRLTSLPQEGLAKVAPNLRVLNLNYNFLEDVKALEGLTRLQKLTLIGSRLKSTKPLIRLVQRMSDVEMLDFRMNPCTLGWYLPLLVKDLPGALQPSEKGGSSSSGWQELDVKFRRDLPDDVYVGRLAYRGLIMRACPRIRLLDGVLVTEKERVKAQTLLANVERKK